MSCSRDLKKLYTMRKFFMLHHYFLYADSGSRVDAHQLPTWLKGHKRLTKRFLRSQPTALKGMLTVLSRLQAEGILVDDASVETFLEHSKET